MIETFDDYPSAMESNIIEEYNFQYNRLSKEGQKSILAVPVIINAQLCYIYSNIQNGNNVQYEKQTSRNQGYLNKQLSSLNNV